MTQEVSRHCSVAKTEVTSSPSELQAPCQNNHLSPTKWKRIRMKIDKQTKKKKKSSIKNLGNNKRLD